MSVTRVFISYSHQDRPDLERLLEHLGAVRDRIQAISDRDVPPGDDWPMWLQEKLLDAHAAVLLVSPRFLGSKFCKYEADFLFGRLQRRRIIPVILTHCLWKDWPSLAKTQALNDEEPVHSPGVDADAIWQRCASAVLKLLEETRQMNRRVDRIFTASEAPSGPLDGLAHAVKSGAFTPLLGPGCHGLPQSSRRACHHLKSRVEAISKHLTNSEMDPEKPSEKESFLREFTKAKVPNIEEGYETTIGGGAPDPFPALTRFQACLVQLNAECCRSFGKSLAFRPKGLTDYRNFKVRLLDEEKEPKALRNLFFKSTDAARELAGDSEVSKIGDDFGLGAEGIANQLAVLTWEIFRSDLSHDSEAKAWKRRNKFAIESARKLVEEGDEDLVAPEISLAQIEWLGDLLWHTLRFQAPLYPGAADLEFQLSLAIEDPTLPRRKPRGLVAGMAKLDVLKKWLLNYAERVATDEGEDFYDAIGLALIRPLPTTIDGSVASYMGATQPPFRLAITTNFDIELEMIFRGRGQTFYVLFPVKVWRLGESVAADDWILYSETIQNKRFTPDWKLLGDISLSEHAKSFHGPLIVKLRGSPLSDLPLEGHSAFGRDPGSLEIHRIEHQLVLTDFDFLEGLVTAEGIAWPKRLRQILLQSERTPYFLGYSLADTDSRLWLYDHVRGASSAVREVADDKGSDIFLVDHPEDIAYAGFLQRANLKFVDLTLGRFAEFIKNKSRSTAIGA